jgi:hypothetical protein
MVTIIPARIEAGRIIPDEPLPDGTDGLRVSVVLRRDEPPVAQPDASSPLARLRGLLKGFEMSDDPTRDYTDYLKKKYR